LLELEHSAVMPIVRTSSTGNQHGIEHTLTPDHTGHIYAALSRDFFDKHGNAIAIYIRALPHAAPDLALAAEHDGLADACAGVARKRDPQGPKHVCSVGHDQREPVPSERAGTRHADVDTPTRRCVICVIRDRAPDVLNIEEAPLADGDIDVNVIAAEKQRTPSHERDSRVVGVLFDQSRHDGPRLQIEPRPMRIRSN
jgi:hypothetical protein